MSEGRPSAEEYVVDGPVRAAAPRLASGPVQSVGERSRHSRKFRGALILLVATGLACLIAALALTRSSATQARSASTWSTWQPTDGGLAGAQEIADYVAPYYRATPAYQLAVITAVDLNSATNPLHVVIPAAGSSGSTSSTSLQVLPSGSTYTYNLCGVSSKSCAITAGQASPARLLLLRREALELALYTFKYISGAQTVVAILPPGHTAGCTGICPKPHATSATKPIDIALAFDRAELQQELAQPLDHTLPEPLAPTVATMPRAQEAELVSVITAHGLFSERLQQAQDGSNLIVLSPMPPQ